MYNMNNVEINKLNINKLDTTQGNLVKQGIELIGCANSTEILLLLLLLFD